MAMPWVYCHLPMMLSQYNRFSAFLENSVQAALLVEESALTDVSYDQLLSGQLYVVNNSGLTAMHKSDDISRKNTFSTKKVWPSEIESYPEVNA